MTGLPQIRFTTATALINELVEAAHANQLGRALDFLPIVKTRNAAVRENCPLYGSYVDEVRQVQRCGIASDLTKARPVLAVVKTAPLRGQPGAETLEFYRLV